MTGARLAAAAVGLAVVCSVTAASGASLAVAGATAHGKLTAQQWTLDDVALVGPDGEKIRKCPPDMTPQGPPAQHNSPQACAPKNVPPGQVDGTPGNGNGNGNGNGKDARVAGASAAAPAAGASDGVRDRKAPASELSDALVPSVAPDTDDGASSTEVPADVQG